MPKIINSNILVERKILKLVENDVILEDGNMAKRLILELNGGVAILAFLDDETILLVKQHRYPIGKEIIELPAGTKEKGEEPIITASRELIEETGYKANSMEYLTCMYSSPGVVKETIYIFIAKDLEFVGQDLDDDEFINVIKMNVKELEERISNGDIVDSKTVLGYLYYKQYKK